MKHLVTIAALALATLPATAAAQDLAVHSGVSIVPWFYGQTPKAGGADREVAGNLGTDLTFKVADSLHVGGSLDGMYIGGAYRGQDGFIYSVIAGPTGMLTSEGFSGKKWVFGWSVTPSVMAYGAVVSGGPRKHSVTLGGSTELSLRVRVTQSILLGGFGGFGLYGPPLGDDQWGTEKLGITSISYVNLGVIWRF